MESVTRENWRQKVRESGLTLVELAARTGMSFSAVYAYSRKARVAPDAWIGKVGIVLREYEREWTCTSCGARNPESRHGCRVCARSYDGYSPSIIRATSHGAAQ